MWRPAGARPRTGWACSDRPRAAAAWGSSGPRRRPPWRARPGTAGPAGGKGARMMRASGAAGLAVVMLLSGSASVRSVGSRLTGPPTLEEDAFARKRIATYRISDPPDATVVGKVGTHRIRNGETFFDVARYYDLGYNELVEANPGVDPLIPPVGASVVLPTTWILPCCTYEGIVVNVTEMRLYFYRRPPGEPHKLLVETYPIGIGRT